MFRLKKTIVWTAGLGLAAAALAAPRGAAAAEPEREIVVLYDASVASHAGLELTLTEAVPARRRGRARADAVRARGAGRLAAATWTVPDAAAERGALAALARSAGVRHVGRNRHWCALGTPRDVPILDDDTQEASVVAQPALDQIDAPGSGGSGISVAVLDGGFDLGHEMLAGHFAGPGWDTLADDADPQDLGDGIDGDGDGITDDMVGHGTFVSGLILAVAPDAQILPYRVLDDEGWGTDLAVWMAITRALDDGADVVNLSMVLTNAPQPLQDAIDDARAQGVVFITAAGNEATGPYDAPELVSRALVVGGVDDSDTVLSWSPSGTHVEIYAPSESLLGPLGGAVSDSYAYWSGTSFGCALVSGAAAQLRAADMTLTPANVESILSTETDAVTGDTGSGRVNVDAALVSLP